MTTLTDTQVITASGGLVELGYATNTGVTVDASPKTLISDTTVVCDGGPIIVEFFAPWHSVPNSATNNYGRIDLYVDGAINRYLTEVFYTPSALGQVIELGPIYTSARITPSAGSHTIGIRAVKGSNNWSIGGGTGTSSDYGPMFMRVSKIVQATQWPAVTTGTIICTSSTRPASPFEGQTIWEGDTDRTYVWNGAAWVSPSVSYKPPMCRAVRTSDTSYTSNTAITWQSVSSSNRGFDTDGMFSSGNATRLTVNTAGVYHVTFQPYITTSSGTYSQAYIRMNGGTVIAETDSASAIAGTVLTNVSVTYPFSVNDYIEGFVVVNGTSPTIKGVTVPSFISAAWIGNT